MENSGHYINDMNCTWSVTAAEGMRIELSFTFFDIEEADDTNACSFDFLQVSFRLYGSTKMNAQQYTDISIQFPSRHMTSE